MSQNQITEEYIMYGMILTGTAFFGGIFMPDAGSFFLCNGIAWVIAIFIFYTGHQKQKEFDDGLKKAEERRIQNVAERQSQKIQKQRKQAELKKRQAAEQRAKDLNHAKWLVEEGGIDNINKAIGIFQKYEK